jgi:orotate phosphoribosyltransferase
MRRAEQSIPSVGGPPTRMHPAAVATENARDVLLDRLVEHAYVYDPAGKIPLASGQLSDEYINCKAALSYPDVLAVAAQVMYPFLKDDAQAVGGLTMGADPLAIAIALFSRNQTHPVRWFSVRKERKEHGLKKLVEGNLPDHSRIAVVDDVVTQGSSTLDAIDRLRSDGHTITQVIVLVDREQGGLAKIRESLGGDVPVDAVFAKSELRVRWQRFRAV